MRRVLNLYKESFSGHPREVWVLGVLTLINRIGTMVIPFLAIYLVTKLEFTPVEAGILVGAFGFGSLGGSWLGGKLSDKIGYRIVILISLLFGGLFLILMQFAVTFNEFYLLIFMTAFFGDAMSPAVNSALGEFVPISETGRSLAFIRLAVNLGFAAAPAIAGFLITNFSYKWLFWVDGLSCAAAAIYFLIAARNWSSRAKSEGEEKQNSQETQKGLPVYKNRKYLIYLLGSFLIAFCFVQWFHTVPIFIKTEWAYDEGFIGILMTFNGLLITFVEMPLIHSLEKKKQIKLPKMIGLALVGISFLPFLGPPALVLCFLAMLFLSMGEITYITFNQSTALNMSSPSRRGEYMGWYAMVWSLAQIFAPVVGLGFVQEFGYNAFWLLLLGISGLSFFIILSHKIED